MNTQPEKRGVKKMLNRCGYIILSLVLMCTLNVPAAYSQEQSAEKGFVKLDSKGEALPDNALIRVAWRNPTDSQPV